MDGKKLLKATGKIAGMGLTFMFGMVAQELLRRDDLCMREDWPHTRILKAVADNWRDKTEWMVEEGLLVKKEEPSE